MFAEEYGCYQRREPVQAGPVVKKIRTHYDNLKVSRTATFDEIRVSYRRLRSLYHTDRNNTAKAKNAIICINEAYDVLSDAAKRAKHDAWIAEEERKLNPPRPAYTVQAEPPKPKQTQYAHDPAGWNPEHAIHFRAFVQEQRVKWGPDFSGLSTDWLYMCFLDDLNTKSVIAKAQEDMRKAKILTFCCGLAIFLATIYLGVLVIK